MTEDAQLLRRFADEGSEAAFRELVAHRIDFVYAAALRQVGGDTHLAQEVAQNVFLDLARKARALASRPTIAGWLYTSTRFVAAKALRSRARRLNHETEAHAMHETLSANSGAEINWNELRPVIDEAMHELGEPDREAILLRYFEGRPLAEVGVALGLAENSARMRVERALEKLHAQLARRGITSTAAALGAAIAAQPVISAPAGLAMTVSGASLAGVATVASAAGGIEAGKFLMTQKFAVAGLVALLGTGFYFAANTRLEARIAVGEQRQKQTLAQLRADAAKVQEQNQHLAEEMASALAVRVVPATVDPLDRLRAVVALIKEGSVGRVTWTIRKDSPEIITPAVSDLFALTAAESRALGEHTNRARQEISALAIAHATVQRNGSEIVIDVPAVPAARESYERMLDGFRQTLGPERFALHEEVGFAAGLEQFLNNLGLSASTLRLSHDAVPRNPEYPYSYSRERMRPGGGGGGGGGGSTTFAGLKLNLGPFAVFVPADF